MKTEVQGQPLLDMADAVCRLSEYTTDVDAAEIGIAYTFNVDDFDAAVQCMRTFELLLLRYIVDATQDGFWRFSVTIYGVPIDDDDGPGSPGLPSAGDTE